MGGEKVKRFLRIAACIMVAVIMSSMIATLNPKQNVMASATEDRVMQISGKVTHERWDYYSLGYLRRGTKVVVEINNVSNPFLFESVFARIDNRDTESVTDWTRIWEGGTKNFYTDATGNYMVQIKGPAKEGSDGTWIAVQTRYEGTITVID